MPVVTVSCHECFLTSWLYQTSLWPPIQARWFVRMTCKMHENSLLSRFLAYCRRIIQKRPEKCTWPGMEKRLAVSFPQVPHPPDISLGSPIQDPVVECGGFSMWTWLIKSFSLGECHSPVPARRWWVEIPPSNSWVFWQPADILKGCWHNPTVVAGLVKLMEDAPFICISGMGARSVITPKWNNILELWPRPWVRSRMHSSYYISPPGPTVC